MKTVLVIPPNLRPMVRLVSGRFATSDLNNLYRRVISRNNGLKQRLAHGASRQILFDEASYLQKMVDALFMNSMVDVPQRSIYEEILSSLSDCITHLKPECSTLLDMLLKRPLDYTAQTHITVEHTGDIDLAFLPERIAHELFSPFIVKPPSDTSQPKAVGHTEELASNNSYVSKHTSPFDCSKFAILISIDSSFSRFIALRFQLTQNLTLKVHTNLMDLLGWELLGKSARIFALFSNEVIEEALDTLAPSRLSQQKSPKVVPDSALGIAIKDIVPFFSMKALLRESVPIGPYEWPLITPIRYPKQGFS